MRSKFLLAFALVLAAGNAALAAATGDQIRAAIAGSTVQGNMDASGPYAEYYAPDGAIKGKDYAGQWSIEGDAMCFAYQGTPKECWNVENQRRPGPLAQGRRQPGHRHHRQGQRQRVLTETAIRAWRPAAAASSQSH